MDQSPKGERILKYFLYRTVITNWLHVIVKYIRFNTKLSNICHEENHTTEYTERTAWCVLSGSNQWINRDNVRDCFKMLLFWFWVILTTEHIFYPQSLHWNDFDNKNSPAWLESGQQTADWSLEGIKPNILLTASIMVCKMFSAIKY